MVKEMKKTAAVLMAVVLCGCRAAEFQYQPNLGYDFSHVKYQDIVFNVYHTDPQDHTWELLTQFPCRAESGHCSDVVLESEGDLIDIVLRDNTSHPLPDESAIVYEGTDLMTYEFMVEGFDGFLPGWQTFAVKEKTGEQPVRLYPISNESSVYSSAFSEGDFNPDIPYDVPDDILDYILITVIMK